MAGASLKPALKKPPPKIGAKAKSTKGVAVRSDDTRSTIKHNRTDNQSVLGQSVFGDDFMTGKMVLKPADQLVLSEAELKVEHTRILTANNPQAPDNIIRFNFGDNQYQKTNHVDQLAVHFHLSGNLIHAESDEAKFQQTGVKPEAKEEEEAAKTAAKIEAAGKGLTTTATGPKTKIRNQFNFGERSAQTVNQQQREREVQTEPPPRKDISVTVNQHVIYDAYKKELACRALEKGKEKIDSKPKEKAPLKIERKLAHDDLSPIVASARITERIVNQNKYQDIADDFKFFNDSSDDFRDDNTGTLLPLWKYTYAGAKKLSVTATQWSPKYSDLFAVGLGSYDFTRQSLGQLLLYSLKNPEFPCHAFETDVGVMCLDIHPEHSYMIAVGLYDGSVAIFNLLKNTKSPVLRCASNIKHTDPVWAIKWQNVTEEGVFKINLCSVSSDGIVKHWTVAKNEMEAKDILILYDKKLEKAADSNGPVKACGTCLEFHPQSTYQFLVGTEEGKIYKCSTSYTSQYLDVFDAHQMAVSSIKWNPFHKDVFLSCSDDWSVKMWTQTSLSPLFVFDLQSAVGDISWSIFSSTSFGAATSDGKVFIYDLGINKYSPLCEQGVVQKKKTKLTHFAFNAEHPICVVGDSKGHCTILKLSPNLRKRPKKSKKDPTPLPVNEEQEKEKLSNLIAIVYDNKNQE